MRWDRQNIFVIAGFVPTYFTVILPGFQMFTFITGGCSRVPLYCEFLVRKST